MEQMKHRISGPVEMEQSIPMMDMEQRIPMLEMEQKKRVLRISTHDSWSEKKHLSEGWAMTDPGGHQQHSGGQQHIPGGHLQLRIGRDSEKCYGDEGERNQ